MKLYTHRLRRDRPHRRFTLARLIMIAVLVAVASVGSTSSSQACGMILHRHVLIRARLIIESRGYQALATLLRDYEWQANYGAVFPDYGFALENDPLYDHSIDWDGHAEIAHTLEFTQAYIEAVKPIFGSSDPEDRKAVAFLFGLIAHNESDNAFHFGPNSFITKALEQDRQTAISGGTCHSPIELGNDVGGNHACTEFQIDLHVRDAYMGGTLGGYCNYWDLPDKAKLAIIAAYSNYGVTNVTADHLLDGYNTQGTSCRYEGLAAKNDLPWTPSHFLSWPDGGREDMANHIAAVWQQAWDELSEDANGADGEPAIGFDFNVYLPALFFIH